MSVLADAAPGRARRITARESAWLSPTLAEEVAVALIYNGVPYAVMMATPRDLEAFGLGFSISEAIIETVAEFEGAEIRPCALGIELRMRIAPARLARLQARQRNLAGCTGCGLCGLESLRAAQRPLPRLDHHSRVSPAAIRRALAALPTFQPLNRATGACHAAAWADPSGAIVAAAEDVGRHNALDKLIGSLARAGDRPDGFLVLTSRCSLELVAKAATAGMPILVAISAPTTLAVETAAAAGLTLVALARRDAMTVYCGGARILAE